MIMSKRFTATVFVKGTSFKCMSKHGNPSYFIEFEPEQHNLGYNKGFTASNAQCGYSANNFVRKMCKIEYHLSSRGTLIIDNMKEVL